MRSLQKFSVLTASLLAISLLAVHAATAACPDGDANNNAIICNDGSNTYVDGLGGNDTIFVPGSVTTGAMIGDGDGGGLKWTGDGGDDVLVNNGTLLDSMIGDLATGDGGNDVIQNNGVVEGQLVGDFVTNTPGNDTIINNGTVLGVNGNGLIIGDVSGESGGNDSITNNGSVIAIRGDSAVFGDPNGGNDTIINNGTVYNYIEAGGGNDLVIIKFGSYVGAIIDGGAGNDTLTFTNVNAAIEQAIYAACPNFKFTCAFTVNGFTYHVKNFENIPYLIPIILKDVFVGDATDNLVISPVPQEVCSGAVKVFRLPNGDLEVYSGFDGLPNGFLVAVIPFAQQTAGATFSDPNAPVAGWSVTLGDNGFIQVFNANGNLVGDSCGWAA